jgi:RNA polymerase sigma-70 factor (ECF subfamily)
VKSRDNDAWEQLVSVYGPTVYGWCRVRGLNEHDAGDLVQTVFLTVATAIERFRREQKTDTFRGWLRTITQHSIADHFRAIDGRPQARGGTTGQIRIRDYADDDAEVPGGLSDSDILPNERAVLCRRFLEILRPEFETQVWESFERTAIHGDRAVDVAASLGITVSSVYKSKTRVLKKLRQVMAAE